MTADIPTLIARLRDCSLEDHAEVDVIMDEAIAALEAQSTELVAAFAQYEAAHSLLLSARAERDAARTAIREALVAWHRGMWLGDNEYIVNDGTIDLAMSDIWDALSRAVQEGGN